MLHPTRTLVAVITVAAGLAVVGGPQLAHGDEAPPTLSVRSDLRDLAPATASPTDGVRTHVEMWVRGETTTVVLQLDGFAPEIAGRTFGAHLHVGPCVAGNGAAAGGHYNVDVQAGSPTPVVSASTELWLDFTVRRDGSAQARASVPFAVTPGDRAVVIHQEETAPNGTAGPRLACLPVVW